MKIVAKLWPAGILFALTVFAFRGAVFPSSQYWVLSREWGDVSTLYFYWRHFAFSLLRGGVIPLWNPYIFGGVPFQAYPESAIFYPPNLIFILFPLIRALNASFVFHFFLLAVFQFAFLRFLGFKKAPSLLGATALVFSAPVLLHVYSGHLSNICTMAWLPLLFIFAEGFLRRRGVRWAVGLGFFFGWQILAGHWQYGYYSVIMVFIYAIFRFLSDFKEWKERWGKWLLGMILFLLIGVGMTAVLPGKADCQSTRPVRASNA